MVHPIINDLPVTKPNKKKNPHCSLSIYIMNRQASKATPLPFGGPYLKFENSPLVVIAITIIGGRENRYDCRKSTLSVSLVHFESFQLGFMSTNNGQEVITMKKLGGSFIAEEEATATYIIRKVSI